MELMNREAATLEFKKRKGLPNIPGWHVYSPNLPEYPGRWVAKLYVLHLPDPKKTGFTGLYLLADSLKEIRIKLPPGLTMVTPDPFDDPPALEEIWV